MNWLKSFLGICSHKWSTIEQIDVYETWDGERYDGQNPAFRKYVLQCSNCGDIKVKRV